MEFITSAILGGILYDISKKGIDYLRNNINTIIPNYNMKNDEAKLLVDLSESILRNNPTYTQEDFIRLIENDTKAQQLIKELNNHKITINNINTNSGAVINGDNHGTINFGTK